MLTIKKLTAATLAALTFAALPACTALTEKAGQEASSQQVQAAPSETVQTVNGQPITRQELERTVKILLAQSGMNSPLPAEVINKTKDTALEQLTTAELLYQAGSTMEIPDLDRRVEEQLARSKARFKSDEEFEKELKAASMTLAEMKAFTRKEVVINTFIEKQFGSKITTSDDEVAKFYNENTEKFFKKGERVRASHILIGVNEKDSFEVKQAAKDKAIALLKKVQGGEDFAALAKAESSCPSKERGGDLGEFTKGRMVPAFEKAAFAMKQGEVSELVQTNYGYHIIKVTERHDPSTEALADVKEKIREYLKRDKVLKQVTDYVGELRGKAKIEKV